MKPPIRLGNAPRKADDNGQRVTWTPPPVRESADSNYEVVWYCHRDSKWLLPENRPTIDSTVAAHLNVRQIRRRRELRQVET